MEVTDASHVLIVKKMFVVIAEVEDSSIHESEKATALGGIARRYLHS